ncbi:hypothetical protein ACFFNA_15890 [Mesorhizobium kowhaii]|uniref:hypothetical protein n=1 Tax=Mesorhizobium kowhaii TaxID=1300272 RepID=UPI0035EF98E0
MAVEFAPLLRDHIRRMGPEPRARTVQVKTLALRRFWTFLDESRSEVAALDDIDVAVINSYENWLEQNTGGRLHQRHLMAGMISLMRLAVEHEPDRFPTATIARLGYLGHGEGGTSRPRDAYSSGVTASLRRAAQAQVNEAIGRVTLLGELPAEPSYLAVHPPLRAHYDKVIDVIRATGRIEVKHPDYQRFQDMTFYWKVRPYLETIHAGFHLTRIDLVGFIVLLSLETGLELECLLSLKADCLRNPSKGYVEIEYYKRRSRDSEWKRLRVRDGAGSTPGGILRRAISLTERARYHTGSDHLWVTWTTNGLQPAPDDNRSHVAAFVARHDILNDDGAPLRLSLSRLRKTHKAERYKRTGGQLEIFAVGHTVAVAARHYADIPALRHIHEQTLAQAFTDALDSALQPVIVLPDTEALMRREPTAQRLPTPPEKIGALLDGEQDVWLASCGGFYASPFAAAGEACATPYWGCLECPNAVITARKLPALLAFRSFMVEQRAALGLEDWSRKFGRAWHRITVQILPAFPADLVAEAQIQASSEDLLYLPAEART